MSIIFSKDISFVTSVIDKHILNLCPLPTYENLGDDETLFEPLANEIKENQWLGVSVSSQKSTEKDPGVVSNRFLSPYLFQIYVVYAYKINI